MRKHAEPKHISDAEFGRLLAHVARMQASGMGAAFVRSVFDVAQASAGAFHLVELWAEAPTAADRDEVVADLQEVIDDHLEQGSTKPKIDYKRLDEVGTSITAHKAKLRRLIDKHGGVSQVAARCGIPQPSLSRMLNSGSMPRRATLFKIASALDVDESEIVGEYTR